MSRRILRRSQLGRFHAPLLPTRPSGEELRRALGRCGRPVAIGLRPGERVIGGRVFYSAAWLGSGVASLEKVKR
jgi:hypothetical protein